MRRSSFYLPGRTVNAPSISPAQLNYLNSENVCIRIWLSKAPPPGQFCVAKTKGVKKTSHGVSVVNESKDATDTKPPVMLRKAGSRSSAGQSVDAFNVIPSDLPSFMRYLLIVERSKASWSSGRSCRASQASANVIHLRILVSRSGQSSSSLVTVTS